MAVKTSWSSGDVLTAADLTDTFAAKLDASAYTPGLSLVTSQSFSAVSAISIDNCFSSTYDNYRVIMQVTAASANAELWWRARASSTDTTTGYYTQRFQADWSTSGSAVLAYGVANYSAFQSAYAASGYALALLDILAPNLAAQTSFAGPGINASTGGNLRYNGGFLNNSTQYDGFTFYPNSGTITGYLRVYGYQD